MQSTVSNPADGRIKSSDRQAFIFLSLFALIWNVISWTAICAARTKLMRESVPAKCLILIFPAAGIVLLGAAVYCFLKWLKFGNAFFEMTSAPVAVGGALAGTIKLGRLLRFPAGIAVRWCCVRRITTGTGKSSSTRETILFECEHQLPDPGNTDAIPVLFAIPADAPATDVANPANQVLWRLTAKAALPGVNLSETFAVPVSRTALTPAQVAAAQRAGAAEATELAHYERPATSRIRVQTIAAGTEFYFPAARNPGAAAGATVFTVILIGAFFTEVHFKIPVVFPVVTGLIGIGLLVALANLWLGTTRVVVTKRDLTVTRRLAGIPRCRTIAGGEVSAISVKPGMTAGTTVYHDIKICLNTGTEISAGNSIRDCEEARWLAGEMARCATVTYRP